MESSYLDRVNPNLIVVLHYASKISWLILAAIFGLVGYKLYALGMDQRGDAQFGIPQILSLSLKDAGPGLIVMVFALACALTGAIRAKTILEPGIVDLSAPTPVPIPETGKVSQSQREFKLFGTLLKYLATRDAFVILNSHGGVEIESFAWTAVPPHIQQNAISASRQILSRDRTEWKGQLGEWQVECTAIFLIDAGKKWCVICADSKNIENLSAISREETRPIFAR